MLHKNEFAPVQHEQPPGRPKLTQFAIFSVFSMQNFPFVWIIHLKKSSSQLKKLLKHFLCHYCL